MSSPQTKATRPKARQSLAHVPQRANTTTDIAAIKREYDHPTRSKRSRGKSLGPGGLDALTETSADVFKIVPQPRSILKKPIPLTPPKAIPSFQELQQKTNTLVKNGTKTPTDELLIDFSTPAVKSSRQSTVVTDTNRLPDPFGLVEGDYALTASDRAETQASPNEAEKNRRAEKKELIERREARRKSLANRRVSFAPEATLHTWSMMELVEESTTSSASNSTRRQSSMTAPRSPIASRTPATVTAMESVGAVAGSGSSSSLKSPRTVRQPPRSRTSLDQENTDSEVFSSPGDGGDSSPVRIEDSMSSESDTDGDTAMSLDEATVNTVRSSDSASSQNSLDERLRQAADVAGTRGIAYDEDLHGDEDEEDDDQPMELVENTVTHAFKALKKVNNKIEASNHNDMSLDKENVNPFISESPDAGHDTTVGMTMEMTHAVGGILSTNDNKTRAGRRRSSLSRRQSVDDETSLDDETMDLTTAKGGILGHSRLMSDDENEQLSEAEMTMDMTSMEQGFIVDGYRKDLDDTLAMDMTVAAGGILPTIDEQTEPASVISDNMTAAMDMTRAVGQILSRAPATATTSSPREQPTPRAAVASESGSPSLRSRSSNSSSRRVSKVTTPLSSPRRAGQTSIQTTPLKQLTPAPARGSSPNRTPVLLHVTQRGASPKKLFTAEIREQARLASGKSPAKSSTSLFSRDDLTGLETPKVVLRATRSNATRHRDASRNAQTEVLGSPKVEAMLERRASLGDGAPRFKLELQSMSRTTKIDPRQLEREVDEERAEEHRRESGRLLMEQEADENNTANLRVMIAQMSPQKKDTHNKPKNRKSLAVGSARGLLGKRPAELDFDDDAGGNTPKRLKALSREGSPVKKVHLPAPPSVEETTGKLSRTQRLRLQQTSSSTPVNRTPEQTPRSPNASGKFKSTAEGHALEPFSSKLDNVLDAVDVQILYPDSTEPDRSEEKISLQEFLNMTNIHFMELSHTKRRNTIIPTGFGADTTQMTGSTSAFVAAATTLPLLELYQHATRELKDYISTGRKIVHDIENETLEDQPPLFRKYMDASAEEKRVFDSQFRNTKTNARLQSRQGWYAWRSQLVDGLYEGISEIKDSLHEDSQILYDQGAACERTMLELEARKEELECRLNLSRQRVQDQDETEQADLELRRQDLHKADTVHGEQEDFVSRLRQEVREKDDILSQASELRSEVISQIKEAQRVQEAQRSLPRKELLELEARIKQLELEHGWRLVSVNTAEDQDVDREVILSYRNELELAFCPGQFQQRHLNGKTRSGRASQATSGTPGRIALRHRPDIYEDDEPRELSVELDFVLKAIKAKLNSYASLQRGSISCSTILKVVSEGWKMGTDIARELSLLRAAGIVRTVHLEKALEIRLTTIQALGRIDISFILNVSSDDAGDWNTNFSVNVDPVYGSVRDTLTSTKILKVQNALLKEMQNITLGKGALIQAIRGFEEWLHLQTDKKPLESKSNGSQTYQQEAQPSITDTETGLVATQDPPASPQFKSQVPRPIVRSPVRNSTAQTPATKHRSPLAPRTTNRTIKKAIPVSTQKVAIVGPADQKENIAPVSMLPLSTKMSDYTKDLATAATKIDELRSVSEDDVFGTQPAIPPQIQEQMLAGTPMKRRPGALRRSPI